MPKDNIETSCYSYIEIDKRRRRLLLFLFLIIFITLSFIIFQQQQTHSTWQSYLPGVSLLGLVVLLIPLSETWVYKPWQKSAERYEAIKISKVKKGR